LRIARVSSFECGGIAEGAHCGVTGFFGAHSGGDVVSDLLVEVELDFVV